MPCRMSMAAPTLGVCVGKNHVSDMPTPERSGTETLHCMWECVVHVQMSACGHIYTPADSNRQSSKLNKM